MKIKKEKMQTFFRSFLYKIYFWLMLLNFKILASEIYVAFLAFEAGKIVTFTLAILSTI